MFENGFVFSFLEENELLNHLWNWGSTHAEECDWIDFYSYFSSPSPFYLCYNSLSRLSGRIIHQFVIFLNIVCKKKKYPRIYLNDVKDWICFYELPFFSVWKTYLNKVRQCLLHHNWENNFFRIFKGSNVQIQNCWAQEWSDLDHHSIMIHN